MITVHYHIRHSKNGFHPDYLEGPFKKTFETTAEMDEWLDTTKDRDQCIEIDVTDFDDSWR